MGEELILRSCLEQGKLLDTALEHFKPVNFKNPISIEQIGHYQPLSGKTCVTSNMEIIKKFFENGKEPPSFLKAGPREKLYFNPEDVQVGIVTPGGVAPGLNTVIHSIVNMHMNPMLYGGRKPVYGFSSAFRGLIQQKYIELSPEITKEWIHKGGTELGTSRGEKDIQAMVKSLQDSGVNILYVVGGDGSLTAAHMMAEEIEKQDIRVGGQRIVIAGVPKTMDNDVLWIWHSFGFDTAAEEAAKAISTIHDDTKSTERICLMQLFGRDAGFLAAHASLASGLADAVLVPEIEFRIEPLLDHIEKVLKQKNYAMVVVAEGAAPAEYSEEYIHQRLEKEGFNRKDPNYRNNPRVNETLAEGKFTFLKDKFDERFCTGINGKRPFRDGRHRVFQSLPRHLIRAVPANSEDQIHCRWLADLAVHSALAGFTDFMISQWLTEYVLVPLKLVAEQKDPTDPAGKKRMTKKLPTGGRFWATITSSTGQPSFK